MAENRENYADILLQKGIDDVFEIVLGDITEDGQVVNFVPTNLDPKSFLKDPALFSFQKGNTVSATKLEYQEPFLMQSNYAKLEKKALSISSITNRISSEFLPNYKRTTEHVCAASFPQTSPQLNKIVINKGLDSKSPSVKPLQESQIQIKRPASKSMSTLIFFDLETTGLPSQMGAENVQITELSMVAVKSNELKKSKNKDLNDIRILNKLLLCIRPRSYISPGAAKITGLQNQDLINEQPFDSDVATAILSFLKRLPKPICILAHNGKDFDFPLLKAELNRLSVVLPPDVYLADTLVYFRDLGVPVFPSTKKICKSVKYNKGKISYALQNLHLYFFNKKPTGSHSAEGDCMALAKVCQSTKDTMLPWIDENYITMDDIKSMW